MAVINTDKYVRRQFHSNTSLWLVEMWRMSAPSSNQLIQACDWLKSKEWMVEFTHAICCGEWEVPTYPGLKMSLKAASFLLARPTCHGVVVTTTDHLIEGGYVIYLRTQAGKQLRMCQVYFFSLFLVNSGQHWILFRRMTYENYVTQTLNGGVPYPPNLPDTL